jgi:peroxiredoxin
VTLAPHVRGRTVRFSTILVGTLGDRCYEVQLDEQRPPRPYLKILDAQGKQVDRISYNFGCAFICLLSWRAPEALSGQFRAVPEIEWGPFRVVTGEGTRFEIAANASDTDPLAMGRPAPEFSLLEPERNALVSLSNLRGRPLVLNFFCGCAWCDAVAETWSKRPPLAGGAELIAVINDASMVTTAGLRRFRERTGFKGRVLADPDHEATLLYGSSECPRVWVIDGEGNLRHVNASRTEPPDRIVSEATDTLSGFTNAASRAPSTPGTP